MLLDRIMRGIEDGQNEKDIIYAWMQELDILEDITFDAIKRAVTRLRTTKEIPDFRQQKRESGAKLEDSAC
jgi:hypothetical protein